MHGDVHGYGRAQKWHHDRKIDLARIDATLAAPMPGRHRSVDYAASVCMCMLARRTMSQKYSHAGVIGSPVRWTIQIGGAGSVS